MTLEHLKKMTPSELFEGLPLSREKGMMADALDRQGLFRQGFKEGFLEIVKKERKKSQLIVIFTMIELNYSASEIAKLVEWSEDEIKKLMK